MNPVSLYTSKVWEVEWHLEAEVLSRYIYLSYWDCWDREQRRREDGRDWA